MNARTRRRLIHGRPLCVSWSRWPAYDAATTAAMAMTDDEVDELLRREQEEADRRWRPVEVRPDAPLGEDVSRTPLSRYEIEWLAANGPLAPGESIPPEDARA